MVRIYFILFFVFGVSLWSQAQCQEQYLDTCKKHLTEDHYVFLKSCAVVNPHGHKDKVVFTYTLLKGKQYEYYFDGSKEGQQEIIATLYDTNHEEVSTSFHHNEFEHKLEYDCEKTGIYYIEFTFKDDEEFCGVASIGFTGSH